MNDPSGAPAPERGKYVTIWKKAPGGQWKAVEDIFNTDAPPPAPPKVAAPTPPKPAASKAKSKKPSSKKHK